VGTCSQNQTNVSTLKTDGFTQRIFLREEESHLSKLLMVGEFGQFYVYAGSQSSTEVRWAGQHVAEMLIPHEFLACLLHRSLNLSKTVTESIKDLEEKN